jgi:hypothetical protein
MRRLLSALAIATSAFILAVSPAAATKQGKYLQSCGQANVGQVDPLVTPGQPADHNHAEFGAVTWGTSTTTADMLSGLTTCKIPGNHSAYWVPTMVASDGSQVPPTSAGGYYGAFWTPDAEQIQPFPVGIRFIVGNSHSTVLQSAAIVHWRCDAAGQPTLARPPRAGECPVGVGVELSFDGPKYWDGINLDTPNHQSHLSYAKDAGHQIRIPVIAWSFHYPAAAVGGMLDSDHGIGPAGRSAHMDLWEAQDPFQQAELTKCLNDPARNSTSSPLCGTMTSSNSDWWTGPLVSWSQHFEYVAPNGDGGVYP